MEPRQFFRLITAGFLIFCSIALAESKCRDPQAVVERILSEWRSQDRFIDGGTLREEAELFIQVKTRRQLLECSENQIIDQFRNTYLVSKWQLSRADAENILKIRKITFHTLRGSRPFVEIEGPVRGFQDEIKGLTQIDLDRLLAGVPLALTSKKPPKTQTKTHFSYVADKLKKIAMKSAIDNDYYAFTVAAIFFSEGFHQTKEAVFESTTRGAEPYTFMVASGQHQVLDLLENLRFTRWEIEKVRARVESKLEVDPKFWDWLARWRFQGTVRTVPVGTVVFPNTPILQVIADPASAIIVESLINPWMSFMTNMQTTAVRNILASGNIPIVTESGTRRLVTGLLTGLTAVAAGADGTSNVLAAELTGSQAYGTVSHAFIGAFDSEMEAVEAFAKHLRQPSLFLPDTYHMLTGIRTAIRGGGDRISSIRQDSNLVGPDGSSLSTLATVEEIRREWHALGRGHWGGIVTNDLTEQSLRELAQSGMDIEIASLGGAFAASSQGVRHGNFVYKLVEMRDRPAGTVRFPIKIADGSKSTEPGAKDLHRYFNEETGAAVFDLKVREGSTPAVKPGLKSLPLLVTAMTDGHIRMERPTRVETANFTADQLRHFPLEIVDPKESRTSLGERNYKVLLDEELTNIRKSATDAVTPKKVLRLLVIPSVLCPRTEAEHVALIQPVNQLFKNQASPEGFDHIFLIPNYESTTTRHLSVLNREANQEVLRRQLRELHRTEIYEETSSPSDTIEILRSLAQKYPGAQIILAMEEEIFWSLGSHLSRNELERLLKDYGIVVVKGTEAEHPGDKRPMLALLEELGFEKRPNAFIGPDTRDRSASGRRIEFFDPHLPALPSSLDVSKFYDRQNFAAIAHVTDPQWTFAVREGDYGYGDQTSNGALAVRGTELTIPRLLDLIKKMLDGRLMKMSFSADAHFLAELTDPSQNGEFHAPTNFPAHGMKGRRGPDGDRFLAELEEMLEGRRLVTIPSYQERVVTQGRKLVRVPFDLPSVAADISSLESLLKFEKNGVGSTDVTTNPHYLEYLKTIDPYKVLPHFHFGWCTDFCDYGVMKRELELGYNVLFIVDVAAGVGAKTTGKAMRHLLSLGMKVMTSEEFHALHQKWIDSRAKWFDVVNGLALWELSSTTKARLAEELQKPRYGDPKHPGDFGESCVVFLQDESSRTIQP